MTLQRSNLSDTDRTNLRSLLDAVITKLKYDEGYDFENEGEDEIMFLDFRKQLKVLLDAVAQVVVHILFHAWWCIILCLALGSFLGFADCTELVVFCVSGRVIAALYEC